MKLPGLSLLLFCISCTSIKWASQKKQGHFNQNYETEYCNEYLKMHFIIFGSATPLSKNIFQKSVPKEIKQELKKELQSNKESKVIFILFDNISPPNNFYTIGIINPKNTKTQQPDTSYFGSAFYKGNPIAIKDSFLKITYVVPVKNFDIKIVSYDLATKNFNNKSLYSINNFYRLKFFEDVYRQVFYSSLKTDKDFNCINLDNIQQYYLDSVNIHKGNYLKQLSILKNKESYYKNTKDRYLFYEFLNNHFSFIDQLDSVKKYLQKQDSASGYAKRGEINLDANTLSKFSLGASEFPIFEMAKKNKIIIFNESHFDWRHRYFVTTLLDSLYKIGYRTIALEALSSEDDSLYLRDYPVQKSGYYLSEPYSANLVRQALRKGFRVLNYEDTLGDGNREYNQAKNIYTKIQYDTSKLVIVAGYGHIIRDTGIKNKAMAGYLWQLTRQKPVIINQTKYSDIFYDKPYFSIKPTGYYSLLPNNDDKKNTDLFIINNITDQPYSDSASIGNNTKYQIELLNSFFDNKKSSFTLLVYLKAEYLANAEQAIPLYINSITKGISTIAFNLPKDNYIIKIQNDNGENLLIKDLINN